MQSLLMSYGNVYRIARGNTSTRLCQVIIAVSLIMVHVPVVSTKLLRNLFVGLGFSVNW